MTDLDSLLRDPERAKELPDRDRQRLVRQLAALILTLETAVDGQSPTSDRGLSVKEAAAKMGMGYSALVKRLNRGEFASFARKKGKRGYILSERGIEAWLGGKR